MTDPTHTRRNTLIRIPRGTIVQVLADKSDKSDKSDAGTYMVELLEDVEVYLGSSWRVRKQDP